MSKCFFGYRGFDKTKKMSKKVDDFMEDFIDLYHRIEG